MVENATTKCKKGVRLDHSVPIPPNCHKAILHRLTIEVTRFLLFQRQQIPEPYQLLTRQYSRDCEEKGETRSNSLQHRQESRTQKQVHSFLTSLKSLEDLLEYAFSEGACKEIHICIGQTPISVRETYCIEFSNFVSDDNPSTVSPQVEKLCCRNLCTTLFLQDEYFLNTTQLSTVHLFVNAKRGSLSKGWLPWPQYKINPKKVQLTLTLSPDSHEFQEIERNKENLVASSTRTMQLVTKASSTAGIGQRTSVTDSNRDNKVQASVDNRNIIPKPRLRTIDCDEPARESTKGGECEASECSTQDLISGELMQSLNLGYDSLSYSNIWYRASIALKGFKY